MSKRAGIINILKPPGMTSFDVVGYVKKILQIRKCGHTGTLDPSAAGVLPVCINKATKVIPYLPEENKEYIAKIELGVSTDTLDADGKIINKDSLWKNLKDKEIIGAIKTFIGKIMQRPPIYSAVKKKGKKLYHYARNNESVDIKKRQVEIRSIDLIYIDLPFIKIKVNCSKGTYIRSLARDIGERLNTSAHLKDLLRTSSGPFKLKDTIRWDQISDDNLNNILIPVDQPFDYRALTVKDYAFKYAINGTKLLAKNFKKWPSDLKLGEKLLIYSKDQFISISEVKLNEDDILYIQALRVFYDGGSR